MFIHSSKKTSYLNNLMAEEYEILLFVKYCYDFSHINQLTDSTDIQLSGYVGMLNLAIQKSHLLKQAGKKAGLKNMRIQPSESYLKKDLIYLVPQTENQLVGDFKSIIYQSFTLAIYR